MERANPSSMSTIHMNFTVNYSDIDSTELCFAEIVLPTKHYHGSWIAEKEKFVEVRGCSKMKQVKSGTQYGRDLDMCLDLVTHPGPAYGYSSLVGDDFDGRDFMRIGRGVF